MTLSILFFLLYLGVVLLIGYLASRKETEEGFMIAERKVAGLQLMATMTAGLFDGATLSIYLAYIYQFGFSAIWLFVGLALGFLFLRLFAERIKSRADELKVYTMSEYFFRVIGKRSGILFSIILIVVFFLLIIVNLIVSGQVLSAIFPLPYALAVLIGAGIVLTYLLLAGFKAVVRTDAFQLLIMILMSVTVAAYLFGKTSIPATEFHIGRMDMSYTAGFLIFGVFGIMVAPDLWQRLFAARDVRTMKRGLLYSAFLLPILAIVLSIIGLVTKQFFPDIRPEDTLVMGFSQLLPVGLKELGMVLLYAVCLSSSDTFTFVVSSIFTRDLQNYTRRFSASSMRRLTRIFILLFLLTAAAVAILYQNIIALGLSLASLCITLFPAIFGSLFFRLSDRAVAWSLILAILSVLILFLGGWLSPATVPIALPVALVSLLIFQGLRIR